MQTALDTRGSPQTPRPIQRIRAHSARFQCGQLVDSNKMSEITIVNQ